MRRLELTAAPMFLLALAVARPSPVLAQAAAQPSLALLGASFVFGAVAVTLFFALWLRARRARLLRELDAIAVPSWHDRVAASERRRPFAELRSLAGTLAAEAEAASFVEQALAPFPETGGRGTDGAAAAAEVALLAVELRRLLDRPGQSRAAAPLEAHRRDLAAIGSAVGEMGGELVGVLGHRVLAAFAGDERSTRAVAAAAGVLERLGTAGSLDAPHVVVASGETWCGNVDYRGRAESAVIGPPLQRIERLLHDAVPGEILVARSTYDEIAQPLDRLGETATPRPGRVGAQEVYALAADVAGRLWTPLASTGAAGTGLLVGGFALHEKLGAGAGTESWKARDPAGRWVVVKRLRDGTELDRAAAETWLEAQRVMASVDSPWVVPILAADRADDCLFAARPYARSVTVRSLLANGEALPRGVALTWGRQLAAGLAAIHAAGLVHAGPRAENALIDRSGVARWVDAGATLGRLRRAEGADRAPEWAERGPSMATDIYGLGALLEEMLLGREARGVAAVDEALRHIVHTCLLEDPGLRYPSAAALLAALDGVHS